MIPLILAIVMFLMIVMFLIIVIKPDIVISLIYKPDEVQSIVKKPDEVQPSSSVVSVKYTKYDNTDYPGNDIISFTPTQKSDAGRREALLECEKVKDCVYLTHDKIRDVYYLKRAGNKDLTPRFDVNYAHYFKTGGEFNKGMAFLPLLKEIPLPEIPSKEKPFVPIELIPEYKFPEIPVFSPLKLL